ncbi:Cytochrome P450, E-class, group I,Cytochrome P450,Cytochrome P450, conserved site [Cinara cedri]|uniref:Cytochrome P450, E-class, group I,Cytochrome P450,Cytochrome P450, conserved site n=1 Tax=Cinara cedri TaxID=506608 RepID=A0A5E4NAU5_9HEMI|nr:Cytochrome P450, E-class, group I,Cytochrome P450,Cytochrome P450, conserved site [Cinara cedri]
MRRATRHHRKSAVLSRSLSTEAPPACKEFNEIPGPKSLPFIGTLYQYLPVFGKYEFDRLHRNGLAKFRQYGPVVREDIVPGVSVVWIFKPEDVKTLYQNEGRHPERRSHLALQKYRLDKPDVYNTGGLLPTNGSDWWRIRKAFQKHLSKVQCVKQYVNSTDTVVGEFVEQRVKRKNHTRDFGPELSRLFLELTYYAAFDKRLQRFKDEEWHCNSECSRLIRAAQDINSAILKTDNGPQLWRRFDTPMYRNIKKGHEHIEKIAIKAINEKLTGIQASTTESCKSSLLNEYLRSDDTDFKDVVGMTVDTLLAGVDTGTYSCCFGLYYLSTNPDAQRKMYAEARALLPDTDTAVTETVLERATYAKAVIKEMFRMNPISVGVGRVLPTDCSFSGYRVPAGTVVVTQNQVSCRLDEYFRRPDAFVPERWLKDSVEYEPVSPYLVLPFGHGPRTCIARRLSEQFLQVILIKIVRNFKMTWTGPKLDCKSLLINKPDGPICIKFKPRTK